MRDEWFQHFEETVDLSAVPLPPGWFLRALQAPESPPGPQGSGLIVTDGSQAPRNALIGAIDGATSIVCLASFLFGDDSVKEALLRASKRGVRCYVLTSSEQRLLRDPELESERTKEIIAHQERTLNELAGGVLVRTGGDLHAKFLLVDPDGEASARGFLSTANIVEEALTRNVELLVPLQPPEVRGLFELFRAGFWMRSERELAEPGRLTPIAKLAVAPFKLEEMAAVRVTNGASSSLREEALEIIGQATDEIWLSTYILEAAHETHQALLKRLAAGAKVVAFVDPRAKNVAAAKALHEAGAELYAHTKLLHAKALLARTGDRWEGLVMTANFAAEGLDEGFEAGVRLDPKQTKQLVAVFQAWRRGFPLMYSSSSKRADVLGKCRVVVDGKVRWADIMEQHEENLGVFQAESMNEWTTKRPKNLPDQVEGETLKFPRQLKATWTVSPPTLPKGGKRRDAEDGFAVWEHGKSRFLVVERRGDLDRALKVGSRIGANVVTLG